MPLDLETVRAYVQIPATVLSDEDLQRMLDTAVESQEARCTIPDAGSPSLDQAVLRRVQREIAAKNLPLGMVGLDASEYGPERLPYFDALVEEHERAFRTPVLG